MDIEILDNNCEAEVKSLFTSVFAISEGEEEGKLIGGLASQLAGRIDNHEIICTGAFEDGSLIAAIFFTRLRFDEPIKAYMLAPVAVSTTHQGKGVGQVLIKSGLHELKHRSASVAVTYGDPAFYSKTGFQVLSENVIQAPLPLSMPGGWLGQSLSGKPIPTLRSRPRCIPEFDKPDFW